MQRDLKAHSVKTQALAGESMNEECEIASPGGQDGGFQLQGLPETLGM